MDEQEWLAERFEANRTHLRVVAYRSALEAATAQALAAPRQDGRPPVKRA